MWKGVETMTKVQVFEKYTSMEINDVVRLAKNGDKLALNYIITTYTPAVHRIINIKNFFTVGGGREDLCQEGIIGIYKAITDFKEEYVDKEGKVKKSNFDSFVQVCIFRNLVTSIKYYTRNKHIPLNRSISLNKSLPDNENLTLMDILGSSNELVQKLELEFQPPDVQLDLKEKREKEERDLAKVMSQKEAAIFYNYIEGKNFKEIENLLGYDVKAIDNAIQRVRRKIRKLKNNEKINTRKTPKEDNKLL